MKKFLSASAAALSLLTATPAFALSEQCEAILAKASSAISEHYVSKVLERATDAIAYIKDTEAHPASPDFTLYMGDWALAISTAWTQLLDAQLRFNVQSKDLTQHTACLRFDLLLIECKMDEVRDEMNAQITTGHSWLAIQRLQELLRFLNERYRHLAAGALDPTYVDAGWGQRYGFDRPEEIWCCPGGVAGSTCEKSQEEQCLTDGGKPFEGLDQCMAFGCVAPDPVPEKEASLCPYNADYSTPFPSGFGCDAETLEDLRTFDSVRDEYDSLKLIQDQTEEFRQTANEFLQIQQKLDAIFGRESTMPDPPEKREHQDAFSCGWEGGYCEQNASQRCMKDYECNAEPGDDDVCVFPTGRCEKNKAIRCDRNIHCGDAAGPCESGDTAEKPPSVALHGPFSANRNHWEILTHFLDTRTAEGYSRAFTEDLKTPSEFSPDKENERRSRELESNNIPLRVFRSSIRLLFQTWSRTQGREEAVIFPAAMDAQLEVANSLTQLRSAVSSISRLASEEEGLRQFVLRFAWFLRRTCMERPCNLALDQIIKIVLTDECFPYAKGDYLGDSVDDPRWQKCMDAASINLK